MIYGQSQIPCNKKIFAGERRYPKRLKDQFPPIQSIDPVMVSTFRNFKIHLNGFHTIGLLLRTDELSIITNVTKLSSLTQDIGEIIIHSPGVVPLLRARHPRFRPTALSQASKVSGFQNQSFRVYLFRFEGFLWIFYSVF